ncbi:protein ecsB [Paenibacillus sp. J31TS4]|uniref:ABC transporter permease n=1 Tax=Paenibacillus sp. J31TS4 TaxID=2807195 RepID=UPI001B2ADBEC|nr:ABC transporter permease [Paenibacillus sp. J31TS4]GIP41372.1 protein ecsB [Paenibacillus sp. J31TS4]
METRTLWSKRLGGFWKEASMYWSYVLRSGFHSFLLLALLAGLIGYARWLRTAPADFPVAWIAVPLLGWLIGRGPVRTLLHSPDRVFLLPAEAALRPYLDRALRYSFAWQALGTLAALAALWPLYAHTHPAAPPLPLVAALFLVCKWASLLAGLQELRLSRARDRRLLRGLAYTAAAAVVYAALERQAAVAGLIALAAVAAGWLLLRRMERMAVLNWEHAIGRERAQLARHYTFFSWFTDVEQLPPPVRPRVWLAGWTRRIPFRADRTYAYLFAMTFARSEAAGILVRTTIVGLVFLFLFPSPLWQTGVFVVVLALSAMQYASLDQLHRYVFWPKLYPVDPGLRSEAIVRIAWTGLLVQTVVLAAAWALAAGVWTAPLAALAAGAAFAALYSFAYLRKKLKQHPLLQL